MVERTDDHPGTGSATYCSAVNLRQASRTLRFAQRSYANRATTSSCMVISPGLGQENCRCFRLGGTPWLAFSTQKASTARGALVPSAPLAGKNLPASGRGSGFAKHQPLHVQGHGWHEVATVHRFWYNALDGFSTP